MNYLLSTKNYNYDLVSYDHDNSPDYKLFLKGTRIEGLDFPLLYNINKESDLKKIAKFNWLSSTGPDLISEDFRKLLELVCPNDVQFFDAFISYKDEIVTGFSALNITKRGDCLDMGKSEFKQTNFDQSNPTYRFYYQVVNNNSLNADIIRCNGSPINIVISEQLKNRIIDNRLKNFAFCQSIDITPQNRSNCEYS